MCTQDFMAIGWDLEDHEALNLFYLCVVLSALFGTITSAILGDCMFKKLIRYHQVGHCDDGGAAGPRLAPTLVRRRIVLSPRCGAS